MLSKAMPADSSKASMAFFIERSDEIFLRLGLRIFYGESLYSREG